MKTSPATPTGRISTWSADHRIKSRSGKDCFEPKVRNLRRVRAAAKRRKGTLQSMLWLPFALFVA